MSQLPSPSAWRYEETEPWGKFIKYEYLHERPKNPHHPAYVPMFTAGQMNEYGQACYEEGFEGREPIESVTEVADIYAECESLREQVRREQIYNQQRSDKIDLLEAVEPMTLVADRFAHRLALELECVLADRPGYYDKAMQALCEYRMEMNAIHEQHSPTHMGEPVVSPAQAA